MFSLFEKQHSSNREIAISLYGTNKIYKNMIV